MSSDTIPLVQCTEWKLIDKGSLYGYATVRFPSGLIFIDAAVFRDPETGSYNAVPAFRPRLDRNKAAVLDAAGKVLRDKVVDFASKESRARWSREVVAAVQRDFPEALP